MEKTNQTVHFSWPLHRETAALQHYAQENPAAVRFFFNREPCGVFLLRLCSKTAALRTMLGGSLVRILVSLHRGRFWLVQQHRGGKKKNAYSTLRPKKNIYA